MRAAESTPVRTGANKTNLHLPQWRCLYRNEDEGNVMASQLTVPNLVSSPLSVNRWKWAITAFDVARQNFYHPTSLLLLLLDLSADFKAPPLLPPLSLSSHFNPLQQSPSVQSSQEPTPPHPSPPPLCAQKKRKKKNCNPNFFFTHLPIRLLSFLPLLSSNYSSASALTSSRY